jgi:translation initiation factor 5A
MEGEDDIARGDAGASNCVPKSMGSLRKGGYLLIKQRPCKIVDMSTSKIGKHGSAKVNVTGIDIFTGKKYEDCKPSSANVEEPIVTRQEYELMDINDNFLSLFAPDSGTVRDDISLPENDVGKEIKSKFEGREENTNVLVSVCSSMGEDHAVSVRVASDKQ